MSKKEAPVAIEDTDKQISFLMWQEFRPDIMSGSCSSVRLVIDLLHRPPWRAFWRLETIHGQVAVVLFDMAQ